MDCYSLLRHRRDPLDIRATSPPPRTDETLIVPQLTPTSSPSLSFQHPLLKAFQSRYPIPSLRTSTDSPGVESGTKDPHSKVGSSRQGTDTSFSSSYDTPTHADLSPSFLSPDGRPPGRISGPLSVTRFRYRCLLHFCTTREMYKPIRVGLKDHLPSCTDAVLLSY